MSANSGAGVLDRLWSISGNRHCADCGAEKPDWASINLGVTLCLECSGIHRSLGSHISQVRSVKLDTSAWTEQLIAYMCSIGNHSFNKVWERALPPEIMLPRDYPNHPAVREAFIQAKYRDRAFFRNVRPLGETETSAHSSSEGVSLADRYQRGPHVTHDGLVVKLAKGSYFGKSKWDTRTLRLEGGTLSYMNKDQVKGTIALEGCSSELLEDDDYQGRPHSFALQTPPGAPNEGRKFVFQCESALKAVEWVQMLRFALGECHSTYRTTQGSALRANEAVDDQTTYRLDRLATALAQEAVARVGAETIHAGQCMVLDVPNVRGVWTPAFVALTKWCLYVFESPNELADPVALIPLQIAQLHDRPDLIPEGRPLDSQASPVNRISVFSPLGYVAILFNNPRELETWKTACATAIADAHQQVASS